MNWSDCWEQKEIFCFFKLTLALKWSWGWRFVLTQCGRPAGGAAGAEAAAEDGGASDSCEQSGGGQRGGAPTEEQSQGDHRGGRSYHLLCRVRAVTEYIYCTQIQFWKQDLNMFVSFSFNRASDILLLPHSLFWATFVMFHLTSVPSCLHSLSHACN